MSSKSKSRSDYICRVRFRNTLPPIPFAPKMLTIPSLIDRHNPYQSNSLIEQTPHSFTMDQSSSIPFDKAFIDNLDILENNADRATMVNISEEDKILLSAPRDGDVGAGSASRRPNVTWLRRSEYIAHEARVIKSRKEGVENKFARSGESARKRNYDSIEDQVAGIENTFRPVPQDLQHPQTKSRAKKITPLLPDMACWENIYTIGQFSAEPADELRKAKRRAVAHQPGQPRPSALDGTDRGILRPMVNPHDSSDTYLVWFLPNSDSTSRLVQQKEDSTLSLSGERLTYNAVCDYEYNNDASAGTKYLLLSNHDDGEGESVVYCPIRSKMNVRKKRALSAKLKYLDDYEKPNVLTVTYT
ncbi:RNA polymerase II-associated [Sporodiniella umbellata]|nr:RNA polymerase II-associated [Sporodiniella umbellata]